MSHQAAHLQAHRQQYSFVVIHEYRCVYAVSNSADSGTLTYMPPEQLASCINPDTVERNHHQGLADLYAIGIALWTLLIGTDPFHRNFGTGAFLARDDANLLHVKVQLVRLLFLLRCIRFQFRQQVQN